MENQKKSKNSIARSKFLDVEKPSNTVVCGNKDQGGIIEIPNHECFDNMKEINYESANREVKINEPAAVITSKDRCKKKLLTNKEKVYRRLTVRECARLQSFPDDFVFFGALSNQYKMVGNAVPPLMAYHLGKILK